MPDGTEAVAAPGSILRRLQTLRVAMSITCIGPEALEIHTGLPFPAGEDRQNIGKVLKLWQNYCIGKKNVISQRYSFNNRLKV